jgi:hypothetical protein
MISFAEPRHPNQLLFPSLGGLVLSESQIESFVRLISRDDRDRHESSIPGGYTYLGQFVAHDFVPGRDTTRKVLPRLNLDSVYGLRGESALDSNGRFSLGPRDAEGCVVDLYRRNGKAQIPEARNDDNVIVAQLHLMFQKIHNELVARLEPAMGGNPLITDAARKINVYLYQRLLIDDYLPRILAPAVTDFLLFQNERILLNGQLKFVPREFSHAAFRFGHSMVRQIYTLRGGSFSLDQLLRRGRPIPAHMALDWDAMFGASGPNLANAIDTELTSGLSKVETEREIVDLGHINIVGSVGLPSGGRIVHHLLSTAPNPDLWRLGIEQVVSPDIEEVLGLKDLSADDLPLWFYFLIEAMCHERSIHRSSLSESSVSNLRDWPGRCLGPLASLIVGEVLLSAIRTSPIGVHTQPETIYEDLPAAATAELHKLLVKLGSVTVQRMVREFPSIARASSSAEPRSVAKLF